MTINTANDANSVEILEVAADFRAVSHAFEDGKRAGLPRDSAFLAAIRVYRQRHPEKTAVEATHEVANLIRCQDQAA